jgi:hypothetical protein
VLAFFLLVHKSLPARMKLLACSLVLIGFSVMIAPWEYVVYVKTGKWVLLSSGGVPTFYDGWDVYRIRLIQATEYIQQVPDDLKALANRAWDGSQQESPMQFIHNELVNEPVVLLKALALKVVRPWYGTDSRNHEKPILLFQMLYGILAIIGMLLTLRRQMPFRFQACVLLSVILLFWGMTVTVVPLVRYMTPSIGCLLFFVAVTIDTGVRRFRAGSIDK